MEHPPSGTRTSPDLATSPAPIEGTSGLHTSRRRKPSAGFTQPKLPPAKKLRPTPKEHKDALSVMAQLAKIHGKAKRPEPRIIACAMALLRSDDSQDSIDRFDSDYAAKDAFGIAHSTNVRQRWIPDLVRVSAFRKATSDAAQGDRVDLSGDLVPGVMPIPRVHTCQHKPVCRGVDEHKATIMVNAQLRRKRWKQAGAWMQRCIDTMQR